MEISPEPNSLEDFFRQNARTLRSGQRLQIVLSQPIEEAQLRSIATIASVLVGEPVEFRAIDSDAGVYEAYILTAKRNSTFPWTTTLYIIVEARDASERTVVFTEEVGAYSLEDLVYRIQERLQSAERFTVDLPEGDRPLTAADFADMCGRRYQTGEPDRRDEAIHVTVRGTILSLSYL